VEADTRRPTLLESLIARLPDRRLTAGGNYELHYGLRNPPVGRGLGPMGVESIDLVGVYAEALERVYRRLRDEGWSAPQPRPVPVYVLDPVLLHRRNAPFTFTSSGRQSQVVLRSFIPAPTREAITRQAEVEAVHEATHTFTHQYALPRRAKDQWYWLDEATATYYEGELTGAPEGRVFGHFWAHHPEWSLVKDDRDCGGYFAAWFVRYLSRHAPSGTLRRVWEGALGGPDADPLATLDAIRPGGRRAEDLVWDYFRETASTCRWAPDLYHLSGERSLTETFSLAPGGAVALREPDELPCLACRYYRVDVPAGVGEIRGVIESVGPGVVEDLRVAFLVDGPNGGQGPEWDARPGAAGVRREGGIRGSADRPWSVLLAVSRAGVDQTLRGTRQQYRLALTAH
jgi:hypothetical protein